MPSGARRRSNKPKKPREPSKEKWYIIRDILQERRRGGQIEYLIDWEDDTKTGEQYPPTWVRPLAPLFVGCIINSQRHRVRTLLQRRFLSGRRKRKKLRRATRRDRDHKAIKIKKQRIAHPRMRRQPTPLIAAGPFSRLVGARGSRANTAQSCTATRKSRTQKTTLPVLPNGIAVSRFRFHRVLR